jgi:protocatechuate 3,4-dioxygenase beta subunit
MSNRRPLVEAIERRTLLAVTIQFDYSLDENGFFSDPTRRTMLQQAADSITSRFTDTLTAVTPSGQNTWSVNITHPGNGADFSIENPTIPANIIRIYAGGRVLGGNTLGIGGPAGWQASGISANWFDTIMARGNAGALATPKTDFAPFAGAITFSTTANWHFGATTTGLSGKSDFLSVATHELCHALGFGTAESFEALNVGGVFTGAKSKQLFGANVPLDGGGGHFAEGTKYKSVEVVMDPSLTQGTRKLMTDLDFAGLDDLGWSVTYPVANTAKISGNVFKDANANGIRESTETVFSSVRIFIDADKDGVFDSTEQSVVTDASGNYTLGSLAAGTYRVGQVVPAGYRATAPSAGYFDVTLTAGQAVTGRTFALTQKVRITGNVWKDVNANAVKESTEVGFSSVRVFLDTNKDGIYQTTEPSVLTDASGNYAFDNLAAGTYRVRQVVPAGWRINSPTASYYDQTLASGAIATAKNFANTQRVRIAGNVFNDANGNKIKDSTEAYLANWRAYVDANNDGVWQSTETSVLTDSSGAWQFNALVAGTYRIRIVQQATWTLTTPTGGLFTKTLANGATSTGNLFGERKV